MNSKIAKALLAATAVVVVLAVVGMAVYHFGAFNMGIDGHPGFWPMMRDRSGRDGTGWGLFGLVPVALVGLGVAVVVAILLGWGRSPSAATQPAATAAAPANPTAAVPGSAPVAADAITQIKELADLHDRGALNDEEFAAAKRKLLGL